MPNITTYRNDSMPQIETDLNVITKSITLPASGILNADTVEVFRFPPSFAGRLLDVIVVANATLGVGATVQARRVRSGSGTAVTAATTAGAASKVTADAQTAVPISLVGNDTIDLLVGGGNVTSSAVVDVHIVYATVTP